MRALRQLPVLAALALLTTACGQWTPPLPSAPSDPAKGATISGTVNGLNSSASATAWSTTSSTPGSGLTVTVVGTDISVTVSGSGKFVLTGVPGGNIQLRFSGPGVDATIAINGVTSEHIQIVVTLNGSTVTIDSMNRVQAGNNAEVEGLITSISHGDRSMKVNGFEIKVREAPIWHGSQRVDISTLSTGQRVHVKGTWVHDYVVATEVLLQNAHPVPNPSPSPGDDPRVELRGPLSGFGGGCPGVTLTVDGRAVAANSATSFRHGPCEHLEEGTWVEVEGTRQGNGSVLAEKIEMKEIEFTGPIASGSACPPGQLVVNGKTVKTYTWTSFEKLACGGFATGLTVEVKGTEHPNGVVKAIRLKYEGE